MARRSFYKVDAELLPVIGSDGAVLYAILESASRMRPKDQNGYFTLFTKYLMEKTGWWQGRLVRTRAQLVKLELIDFIQGKNQNVPGRYKIKH